MTCPRKYELGYVEGWQTNEETLDLDWGSAFHDLLESYWRARIEFGQDHEEALRELTFVALDSCLPVPVRPNQMGKTNKGLARSLVWYFEKYDAEQELPTIISLADGSPAIEMKFDLPLDLINPDGEPYRLLGYLDSLREFNGSYTVWDYKTTGGSISPFYRGKWEVHIQNHIYTIAAHSLSPHTFSTFMIDVVGAGVTMSDFHRIPIMLTKGELAEALDDVHAWIRQAERYAELGYYPKNATACNWCQFKPICGKDPKIRIKYLESDFTEKRREVVGR